MKKISYFVAFCAMFSGFAGADAASQTSIFKTEVRKGLGSDRNYATGRVRNDSLNGTIAYGEMGREVFYDVKDTKASDDEYSLFIPTSMYVRMGGGMNLGVATKKARDGGETHQARNSWNVLLGLGWNMSSYVRTELAFQETTFRFKDIDELKANYNMLNGMLYFDFARRYVQAGDVTYRRTIVPFMGLGMGIGEYNFDGANGANGMVVAAPRAELGVNFMFNNTVGLDLAYQYQLMFGHGFGWNTSRSGADGMSNLMATIRVNF